MVIKQGKFQYNISEFESKAEKFFPNSNIYVGAKEGVDEEVIQAFFESVMNYEIANAESDKKQKK